MQVKWNRKAEKVLNAAVEYGIKTFSEEAVRKFYQQIKSNDSRLAANPEIGKIEPLLADIGGNYRSLVVHEHYKLIYHIVNNTLRIADMWDTRIDPKCLALRIK